ncbi:MAG: hypothetical protein ACRCTR_04215 [Actinomycetota bacterium]
MQLRGSRVLAFGTAGAQGSGLTECLSGRGATPVRVTTQPERAHQWSASGEQAVVADLLDPASMQAAGDGVPAAALHLPLGLGSPEAAWRVVASVQALRDMGTTVAVNLGTVVPPPDAPDPFGARPVAQMLLDAGATVITPTAYLENHAAPWSVARLVAGELLYPRPIDDLVGWLTARDITASLVAALERDLGTQLLALGGTPLTFDELAAQLTAGLGRPVEFRRVSAEEFGNLVRPYLGDEAAAGVAAAYDSMPESRNPLMAPDANDAWETLGLSPTPAAMWATRYLATQLPVQQLGDPDC